MAKERILDRAEPLNGYGIYIALIYSINAVFNPNLLNIPWAFQKMGYIVSVICLGLNGLLSYYLSRLVIEILARVDLIDRLKSEGYTVDKPNICENLFGQREPNHLDSLMQTPMITGLRYDLNQCASVLFGKAIGTLYLLCMIAYFQAELIWYAEVFVDTITRYVPLLQAACSISNLNSYWNLCRVDYWIYLGLFSQAMFFFSMISFRWQKWWQVVLQFLKLALIVLVAITCLELIGDKKTIDNDTYKFEMPTLAHWEDLYKGFQIFFYVFLYQLQLPSFIEHVGTKKRLWTIPFLILCASVGFYLVLGLIVPLAIKDVDKLFTQDYRNYSAGHEQAGKPWWTDIIAYVVALSPCMIIASNFPISAISLSNAVTSLIYGPGNEETHDKQDYLSLRWLTVTFSIGLTFFFYDLAFILDYVRLVGFFLIPIFIPIMHIAARQIIGTQSPYDAIWAPKWLSLIISVFHIFLVVYIVIFRIFDDCNYDLNSGN